MAAADRNALPACGSDPAGENPEAERHGRNNGGRVRLSFKLSLLIGAEGAGAEPSLRRRVRRVRALQRTKRLGTSARVRVVGTEAPVCWWMY